MAVRLWGDGGRWLLPALFFLSPFVTSVLPRTTPLFLPLIFLTLYVGARRRGLGLRQLLPPSAAFAACLLLSLYAFINASWAPDQSDGLIKAAILLGGILIAFAGSTAIVTVEDRQIRRAAIAFVAGASIGAFYLLLELLTEGAITRAAINSISALRPEGVKHIKIVHGDISRINMSEFNQAVTLVTLYLWPGLMILGGLKANARRTLLIVLFFVLVAAVLLISEHDSSQAALLGSTIVLMFALRWPRLVTRLLAALWCLGFVLVLPLNFLAYDAGLHFAKPLPNSYKARVIIWEYTSERVLENPLLGVGLNATATTQRPTAAEVDKPEGFVFKRTTAHHAHNIFLQTLYELGALGAVLFAIAGALIVLRIDLLPVSAQPFAAATFAAFVIVSSFAWGMWQTWFMCGVALVPLCLGVASAAAREFALDSGNPRPQSR